MSGVSREDALRALWFMIRHPRQFSRLFNARMDEFEREGKGRPGWKRR